MKKIIFISLAVFLCINVTAKSVRTISKDNKPIDTTELAFNAAWRGDTDSVKFYVQNGFDLKLVDQRNGADLLSAAASSGNTELVKYLLGVGADVKYKSESGETALHYATWKGNVEMSKVLVEAGADVNAYYRANGGLTPLCCAAESGSLEIVKYLVAHGAKATYEDKDSGGSPLRSAAYEGHYDIFLYFAQKQPAGYNWQEVLFYGIIGGNLDIIKYAIEKRGASVNIQSKYWDVYPIESAADNLYKDMMHPGNYVDIIKYLRSKGARLRDINNGQIFPWAMEHSNEETIAYFLESGVKISTTDDVYGWPMLPAALDNGNFVLAKYLLGKDKEPTFNNMPLVVFFADGLYSSPPIIDFLIKNGVNTKHYPEAFIRSVQNDDSISTHLLLNTGVDINTLDKDGANALAYIKSLRMASFLIEKGIDTSNKKMLEGAWDNFPLIVALDHIKVDIPITKEQANEGLVNAARIGHSLLTSWYISKGAQVNDTIPSSVRQPYRVFRNREGDISGRTALIENAIQGYEYCNYVPDLQISPESARILIQAGANVNQKDASGKTALHYASGEQWCKVPIWPIPMGSRRDRANGAHGDPVMPPEQHHDSILQVLIDAGAWLDEQDQNGDTPLLLAAQNNNYGAVKILLKSHADVNIKNKSGKTVFDYASDNQMILAMKEAGLMSQVSQETLNSTIEVFLRDRLRSYNYDLEEFKSLIANGADINYKFDYYHRNALMYVLDLSYPYEKKEVVQMLLDLGINRNDGDDNGKTALMYAIDKGTPIDVVKILLKDSMDVEIRDKNLLSALTIAKVNDKKEFVNLLVKAGAKRDITAEWWLTLYEHWRESDVTTRLQSLIKDGAKIDAQTTHDIIPNSTSEVKGCGITALMYLAEKKKAGAVKTLIQMGADVNIKDKNGKTALTYAREAESNEVANILIQAGGK